jgi:hypothetical protein
MKKTTSSRKNRDELRPEYDLADRVAEGVRGKYVADYRRGTNLVLLDPDVASAFESDAAVNEALRLALKLADLPRSKKAKRLPHDATT